MIPRADPGFQVRGTHLKKLRRAEGGAKIFGVFRVKNHDFTPKNHIFSNFRGGGGRPLDPPLDAIFSYNTMYENKYLKNILCCNRKKSNICMQELTVLC